MAKHKYGRKKGKKSTGHRKSAKRVAAGKKAARTRRRNAGLGKHVGRKRSRVRTKGRKNVSAKRRAAGKRLWALMKSRHGGHAGAVAYLQRMRRRAGR
jgi:hypothetical protein